MPLAVYKSSAGSGKTTTLVQAYLRITLANPGLFRNVLAITFTNKAANEMKSRVLSWLKILSKEGAGKPDELNSLQKELEFTNVEIQDRAKKLLSLIMHNYDEFSISTIDSFVHRIIKTFSTDVKLPQNFEVVIEEDDFIPEIIRDLYEKVGIDKDITNILVNFVLSNFEEEKAHDPTNQLYSFIQKQIKEEGFFYNKKMLDISLPDFQMIIQNLRNQQRSLKQKISNLACNAIDLIGKSSIEPTSFYQGKRGIFNYFEKICSLRNDNDVIPNSYVSKTVEDDNWYSGKCPSDQKNSIDNIKDQLTEIYGILLPLSKRYMMYSLIYKKIYDVALIKEIRELFDAYASRNQKVHISEFNKKISESIAEQPVPFIYERLGRKYHYFLIDEFQDTSVLQWRNLLPLIEESLAYGNFNMLVGDAKQAIYRFRNGEVELFSSLPKLYPEAKSEIEQASEKLLEEHYDEIILGINYRSDKIIVDFNNSFFKSIIDGLQGRNKKIYEGHLQQILPKKAIKNKGYVKIELVEEEKIDDYRRQRLEKIRNNIDTLKESGYQNKDICILTNQNKYAAEIASYLIEQGYNIISHESLLLKNAPGVRMVIALMKLLSDINDRIQLANFIENMLILRRNSMDFHDEYINAEHRIELGMDTLMESLGYPKIHENEMAGLSVYELVEYIISNLFGETNSNIFLHFFLDFAYDNQHVGDGSLAAFIEYWEKKCNKIYITMPDGVDAIQVMTIHKAKGLKFESVILDFIPRNNKITRHEYWTDLELEGFDELKVAILPLVKELEFVDLTEIYNEEEAKTTLDLLNMMYVAFTRPVSALFIVSQKRENSQNRFTSYIQNFFSSQAYNPEENLYKMGTLIAPEQGNKKKPGKEAPEKGELKNMISSAWKGKIYIAPSEPVFWEQIESTPANTYGKLIHNMLAEIFVPSDIEKVITKYVIAGIIEENEALNIKKTIDKLVNHEALKELFSENVIVKNETELVTVVNGINSILRPDRVVINGDDLSIIDYKTGAKNEAHLKQILEYASYFNKLGYINIKKTLVYLNKNIEIVNV